MAITTKKNNIIEVKFMEHPIHSFMKISMENIKEMVDVDTIVGQPIHSALGSTIIPISKVRF